MACSACTPRFFLFFYLFIYFATEEYSPHSLVITRLSIQNKLHQLKLTNKTWIKTSECGLYSAVAPLFYIISFYFIFYIILFYLFIIYFYCYFFPFHCSTLIHFLFLFAGQVLFLDIQISPSHVLPKRHTGTVVTVSIAWFKSLCTPKPKSLGIYLLFQLWPWISK